jgi:hypothetical protein
MGVVALQTRDIAILRRLFESRIMTAAHLTPPSFTEYLMRFPLQDVQTRRFPS